ncbi:MAG TPA: thiamine-phosphate kinase [Bacteroidetes bacterium]|nr:thiamine-phosphate kinase [Bacteroidota bacterium]
MAEIKRTEISTLGEFCLIEKLTKDFEIKNPSTIKGVGDDAAVLDYNGFKTVVSTDLLMEGIHFDLSYFPLRHLGFKSVIVNLSDIYSMNAIPKQITVSLGLSNRFSVEALEEIYFGIKTACEAYGVDLVGGDTTSSHSGLTISITAIGQGEENKLAYRSGAKPGDIICVTGDLGASYLGLQLLERERQLQKSDPNIKIDLEDQKYLIGRFLKPEARKDIIELFQKSNLVPTSMIDISDGLASELFHISKQSKVGILIEEDKIPIHPDTQQMALKFQVDPTTAALSGGEDYELLFTVDPKDLEIVRYLPDVSIIGEVKELKEGINLLSTGKKLHKLKAQGWKHF